MAFDINDVQFEQACDTLHVDLLIRQITKNNFSKTHRLMIKGKCGTN